MTASAARDERTIDMSDTEQMVETDVADAARPKRKLDLELENAYYQLNPLCYYCGGCLVDGPTPDFEIAYLAVLC